MTKVNNAVSEIFIYADGACSGNPGPGGWGAVLICANPERRKEISGGEPETTNNRMELTAVISALSSLKKPCRVTVVTDSRYIVNAFNAGWIKSWQTNGWRTADKKPVKNTDLWQELLSVMAQHKIDWQWVKGHAGHPENEQADRLAVSARDQALKQAGSRQL